VFTDVFNIEELATMKLILYHLGLEEQYRLCWTDKGVNGRVPQPFDAFAASLARVAYLTENYDRCCK